MSKINLVPIYFIHGSFQANLSVTIMQEQNKQYVPVCLPFYYDMTYKFTCPGACCTMDKKLKKSDEYLFKPSQYDKGFMFGTDKDKLREAWNEAHKIKNVPAPEIEAYVKAISGDLELEPNPNQIPYLDIPELAEKARKYLESQGIEITK